MLLLLLLPPAPSLLPASAAAAPAAAAGGVNRALSWKPGIVSASSSIRDAAVIGFLQCVQTDVALSWGYVIFLSDRIARPAELLG